MTAHCRPASPRYRAAILAASLPLLLSTAPAPALAQAQAQAAGATTVLLDQAHYWQSQNKLELARNALDRLLRIDPGNAEGLALLAQMQASQGDQTGAEATLALLRQQKPNHAELGETERSVRIGAVDATALASARSLAQQGRASDAVEAYQGIFHGTEPPDSLAVEYYQVLSATPSGWQAARDGLTQQVQARPADTRSRLALAELLTYREPTRADGIARLQALAAEPATSATATRDWRQALQWLAPFPASIPAYQAFLAVHPDDSVIAARMAQARVPSASAPIDAAALSRSTGFTALTAGRLDAAEAGFNAAIARDPNDADALGGLGLVQLRRGNTPVARSLLTRAIAADPAHRQRWEPALAGAGAGAAYGDVRTDMARGRLDDAARSLDGIIRRGGDTVGAHAMLADVDVRQGRLDQAEINYRIVLRARPGDSGALIGLAQVLQRQNRMAEADDLMAQAEASGHGAAIGQMRGARLHEQAQAATDRDTRVALLRAAREADPNSPWITLDLARALQASGQKAEATATMAALTGTRRPNLDALRAGVIFASESGNAAEAEQLINRLPRSARTPEMLAVREKAAFTATVQSLMADGLANDSAGRDRLVTLAAHPDPDGSRGGVIAAALIRIGAGNDVPTALSTALAATPSPTAAQRLAYAGLLMQAGRPANARRLISALDDAALTPDQRAALNGLRAGAAIQASDTLNNGARTADAYDQLAPALRRDPDNADLNLALGRLYMSDASPRRAQVIDEAVLQRDPANLAARRSAVEAAIQLNQLDRAEGLANEGMANAPNEPGAWVIAAIYERSVGNNARALQDLRTARGLRRQQIGITDTDTPGQDDPPGGPERIMETTMEPAPANPFRRGGFSQGAQEDPGLIVPAAPIGANQPLPATDAMSSDIDTQIATLQDQLAPKVEVSTALRDRSGSGGLDSLQEVTVPIQGSFSPGRGRLTATATPTFLDGGQLDASSANLVQFGTNALGGAKTPGSQTASGVALDANWVYRWLSVDAGSTPLGFLESNVTGGIELAPALNSVLRLRVTGERRAVTDSVLSYAGTEDDRTGNKWGGVTRTRGHAQFELTEGRATFYAGGGYNLLDGSHVKSNGETEIGVGGAYPFYRTATAEARIGLDLVYFGYDHNLRYFTYGQGGYFSPQSYFAAVIPFDYRDKTEDLSWNAGASVGYQTYNEHASNVYPNDPVLQAQVASLAAGSTTIVAQHPGKTASGIVGGAHAGIEYNIAPQLVLGGKGTYQKAGDWNEAQGLVYMRYTFNGAPH